jgi:hypothetical protein
MVGLPIEAGPVGRNGAGLGEAAGFGARSVEVDALGVLISGSVFRQLGSNTEYMLACVKAVSSSSAPICSAEDRILVACFMAGWGSRRALDARRSSIRNVTTVSLDERTPGVGRTWTGPIVTYQGFGDHNKVVARGFTPGAGPAADLHHVYAC